MHAMRTFLHLAKNKTQGMFKELATYTHNMESSFANRGTKNFLVQKNGEWLE